MYSWNQGTGTEAQGTDPSSLPGESNKGDRLEQSKSRQQQAPSLVSVHSKPTGRAIMMNVIKCGIDGKGNTIYLVCTIKNGEYGYYWIERFKTKNEAIAWCMCSTKEWEDESF